MSSGPFAEPHEVTLVHSTACHFCDEAQEVLRTLALDHPVHLTVVPLDSPEGRALVAAHRPAMNPLVLVDGVFFSSGRFPRTKFLRTVLGFPAGAARSAAPGGPAGPGRFVLPGRSALPSLLRGR